MVGQVGQCGRLDQSFGRVGLAGAAGVACCVFALSVAAFCFFVFFDQTLTPMGESAIEIIVRKRLPAEVLAKGRLPNADKQLTSEGFTLLTGYKAHG